MEEDIKTLKNMNFEKYPLKAAIICSSFDKYSLNPGRKMEFYYYFQHTPGPNSFRFNAVQGAKEFFPFIFKKVDYISEADVGYGKYDVIVWLNPTKVEDLTNSFESAKKSVSIMMTVDVVITDAKTGERIMDRNISALGTCCPYGKRHPWSPLSPGCLDDVICNYNGATENVLRDLFLKLGRILSSRPNSIDEHVGFLVKERQKETEKERLARQKEIERETLPSELSFLQIQYSDSESIIPNNTIDAGEKSLIIADVKNKGKGRAFDVKLKVKSDNKDIDFTKSIPIGDIEPGETKRVNVNINAGLNLDEDGVSFLLSCTEKRGYDSSKIELNVPTSPLVPPDLFITSYKVNDGNSGLAHGNGNGIPENGETIEILPFIKNKGVGEALRVSLLISSVSGGVEVKKENITIPRIMPGQTVSGQVALSIPRTFTADKIQVSLRASDARGASDIKKDLPIKTKINQPHLACSYKILPRGRNGLLENGDEGEIEIQPLNKGELDATGITVDLHSEDLKLSKTRMEIDRIDAGTTYVRLRFRFKVPRTLERDLVDVRVRFAQKDFAGFTDHIHIPIKIARPDFQISHQIRDTNNNGAIEQGETVDLIVRLTNTGSLDADDVVLGIDLDGERVRLNSDDKEVKIGKIPAGGTSEAKTFSFFVLRRAVLGDLPIHFNITQRDFQDKKISLLLNVMEEKPVVISVAGQKSLNRKFSALPSSVNLPPVIAIASPMDNSRVASESVILSGTAVDDKGISSIEIMVNGRRQDPGRSIRIDRKTSRNQSESNFNTKVPLQKESNEITVTVYDIENLSTTKTITVYREMERGEIWAAVIGINSYQNREIPSLQYARGDAQDFADYLRSTFGLDHKHIFELYDQQATLRKLRSLLGTILSRNADKPEDTVFIYFAGHGAPERDSESIDGDGVRKYMLAFDSDPQDFYGTALPMDEIARIFSRIKAERIVFFVDSCYSGGSGGRTILASGRRANLSDAFLERIARGRGRIIITSSNANEVSQESNKLRHGFFTYYLLKGLKGEADVSEDGLIDIDEIYLYLNRHVPAITSGKQHPVKKGDAEGEVIIGRVR